MKKIFLVRLLFFVVSVFIANNLFAQHIIAIQSEDKKPFSANVNGVAVSSGKTGALRLSNLAAGTYNISIATGSVPAQTFACVVNKSDENYVLKNMPKKGWVLKNVNSSEVIAASVPVNTAPAAVADLSSNVFAQMLAQVVNDPDLLKPTVWVYSNKVDIADVNVVPDESQNDTTPYVPATTGVIKASEQLVNGGTEMVFVDFTATGGDTIHVLIPSKDSGESVAPPPAQTGVANNTNTSSAGSTANNQGAGATNTMSLIDSTIAPQKATNSSLDTASNGDITLITAPPPAIHKKTVDTTAFAVDTSSGKKIVNPFFSKSDTTAPQVQNATERPPAPPISTKGNTGGDNALVAEVKTDCKRMLSDKEEEKLKHKIYLETDENKEIEITTKALDGKCINTAQVKDLVGFFLSDEGRLSLLQAVYPFVYDYGNFGALGSYIIDSKYKATFEAMIK